MRLDTSLHGNNARGMKYAVYYASVVMHTVFENIKWLHSISVRIKKKGTVASLACLFPGLPPTLNFESENNHKHSKFQDHTSKTYFKMTISICFSMAITPFTHWSSTVLVLITKYQYTCMFESVFTITVTFVSLNIQKISSQNE